MPSLELKPTHKPIVNYYAALRQFDDLGVSHEGAVKSAFHGLLDHCARQHDWTLVIDQYQVSTDKRSGITNDPNRPDDPEYIVRLLGQVITVSLETVKAVKGLPVFTDLPDELPQ
jgi:hypothetical protein